MKAKLGGSYNVFFRLYVSMVTEIVARNVSAYRVSITKGVKDLENPVHPLFLKDWNMNRIVCNDCTEKSKKTGCRNQTHPGCSLWLIDKSDRDQSVTDQKEGDGTSIGLIL